MSGYSGITYDEVIPAWTIIEDDLSNVGDYTYGFTVEVTSTVTFSETFEYEVRILDPCFLTIFTIDGSILGSDGSPPLITYEHSADAYVYVLDLDLITQSNDYLTASQIEVCSSFSLDFSIEGASDDSYMQPL